MSNKTPLPISILVVDDEEGMRITLVDILEEWVAHVDQAANGEEAVRKTMEGSYDLVLMDVRMPILDGIQALRRLQDHGAASPVVLMTAYEDLRELASVRAEALAILPKPLDLSALMDLVHTVFDKQVGVCEKGEV